MKSRGREFLVLATVVILLTCCVASALPATALPAQDTPAPATGVAAGPEYPGVEMNASATTGPLMVESSIGSVPPILPRPTDTFHQSPLPQVISLTWAGSASDTGAGDDSADELAGFLALFGLDTGNKTLNESLDIAWSSIGIPSGGFNGAGSAIRNNLKPNCMMRGLLTELDSSDRADSVMSPDTDLYYPASAVLQGLTPGQWAAMQREYSEEPGFLDTCYDTNPNPYWDIVTVDATFLSMSARQQHYDITLYVHAHGAEIPAMHSLETLDPSRLYKYTVYIPVKSYQVKDIDGMELRFVQADG
jgi:hypothetical protein